MVQFKVWGSPPELTSVRFGLLVFQSKTKSDYGNIIINFICAFLCCYQGASYILVGNVQHLLACGSCACNGPAWWAYYRWCMAGYHDVTAIAFCDLWAEYFIFYIYVSSIIQAMQAWFMSPSVPEQMPRKDVE